MVHSNITNILHILFLIGCVINMTYTPPPKAVGCDWPILCSYYQPFIERINGSLNDVIATNTDVAFIFGGLSIPLCKTSRTASQGNAWTLYESACDRTVSSACFIKESCVHEHSEILYINNQENVLLYRHTSQSIAFSRVGNDFIGDTLHGAYPYIGKVWVHGTDISTSWTETIILVKNGTPETLHTYIVPPDNKPISFLMLIQIPESGAQGMTEAMARAIEQDLDVIASKKLGGYYSGGLFYPPWISSFIGKGDAIWYLQDVEQGTPTS